MWLLKIIIIINNIIGTGGYFADIAWSKGTALLCYVMAPG